MQENPVGKKLSSANKWTIVVLSLTAVSFYLLTILLSLHH